MILKVRLELLLPMMQVDETPEVVETITTDSLTWQRYELSIQGFTVHLALADGDGETILVLLTATPGEADDLFEIGVPARDLCAQAGGVMVGEGFGNLSLQYGDQNCTAH